MDRKVATRGAQLAVVDEGAGVPFVWGHGLLGSTAQETATGLFGWPAASEAARLVRFDARGHGRSTGAGSPSELTWPELARDLWALIDELALDHPILGGTSMGSATALHAATLHPDRVRALVLALPPTAWSTRGRQRLAYRAASPLVCVTGTTPLAVAARWAPRHPLMAGELAPVHDALIDGLRANGNVGASRALRGAARSDLPPLPALAELTIPVLILSWDGDPTHPRSTAEALAQTLPDARWHHATDAADVLGWPDLVLDLVAEVVGSSGR